MGQGIDAARAEAPLHADVLDNLKDQLLIAFMRRLGTEVSIPVQELDDTGRFVLAFSVENGNFNFQLSEKQ